MRAPAITTTPTLTPTVAAATVTVTPTPAPTPVPPTASPLPADTAPPSPTTSPTVSATASPTETGAVTTPRPGVPGTSAPVYTYRVVATYPHDEGAYTQGLVFENGVLYESTGLYGRSSLREVDLETGKVVRIHVLPEHLFGEGIAVDGDRIVQLTWRSHVGFVYDRDTFDPIDDFRYPTEGWGLTHDGAWLIMSDGTPTLHFLDPVTLQEVARIEVMDGQTPIGFLNELEHVRGQIFANIWLSDLIVIIDPATGQVAGWVDLSGLLDGVQSEPPVDVLNGIAYDEEHDRLFVTGKLWPLVFEIELIPVGGSPQ